MDIAGDGDKEIAGEKAQEFLQPTNWHVEEDLQALQLFYEHGNASANTEHASIWDVDGDGYSSSADTDGNRDDLADLFRPPFELMCKGNFEQTKVAAAEQGKWLIANVQSTQEFSSHELNRDTWGNEAVKETISAIFVFWQVTDDREEGRKVCGYYGLTKMPSTLVIDPITGAKVKQWNGMIHPERLMEGLLPFMDNTPLTFTLPKKHQYPSLPKEPQYPSLPKEPQYPYLPQEPEPQAHNVCRVAIRFPDAKRGKRRFLRTDSIGLLWSFCFFQVEEVAQGRKFRLVHTIAPGASKALYYDNSSLSFGDAGLSNSLLSMVWE